jgi:hypothetical protein
MSLPPVRVRNAPCDFCGSISEAGGRNYDVPDNLIPGNPKELNEIAQREQMEAQGGR